MKKKLIIHVGSPKTGSSFIQSVFRLKSELLNSKGVLFPGVERSLFCPNANVDINGQLLTRIFRLAGRRPYRELKPELFQLLKSLFELDSNCIFISDESLSILNPVVWDLIAEVCSELNISLCTFAYFRKPDSYYPSHWAQVVRKHGEIRSLIDFATEEHLPVWKNLLHMDKTISETYLFSYEQERNANGLLLTAAKVLGIDAKELLRDINSEEVVNASLSLKALTAIRSVNLEYGELLGNQLNDLLTKASTLIKVSKPELPLELKQMVTDKHLEEFQACIRCYTKSLSDLSEQ